MFKGDYGYFLLWISALIFRTLVLGSVLAIRVTDLVVIPDLPELSNVTLTSPSSPGATGVLVYSGTVHPHEADALEITKGAFPVFLNLNV